MGCITAMKVLTLHMTPAAATDTVMGLVTDTVPVTAGAMQGTETALL